MSRHEVPATARGRRVMVGWDPPLSTFFVQIYDDSRDEDENPVLWLGASRPRELQSVEDVEAALQGFAELGPELRAQLQADKDLYQ